VIGWSPYVAGVGIGILSWLTLLLADKTIGVSGGVGQCVGLMEKLLARDKVEEKLYYKENSPGLDWSLLFVIGIGLGSFLAAVLGGDFKLVLVPEFWQQRFGSSIFLRWLAALVGGVFIGFGARWAGGCTSGHGISGTLQLSVISWITFLFFFLGGAGAAFLLYSL
jgi:uncharacterized membrane protein YedE/YeeE